MKFVFSGGNKEWEKALAHWVMKRIGMRRVLHDGEFHVIGVMNSKNKLVAGVMYHDYDGKGKISLSMAADDPSWCKKGIIAGLLHYPFVQLNCHVIVVTVGRKNKRVRKLAEGLKFRLVGIVPNWPNCEDQVIYALRREDAVKWFPPAEKKEAA